MNTHEEKNSTSIILQKPSYPNRHIEYSIWPFTMLIPITSPPIQPTTSDKNHIKKTQIMIA